MRTYIYEDCRTADLRALPRHELLAFQIHYSGGRGHPAPLVAAGTASHGANGSIFVARAPFCSNYFFCQMACRGETGIANRFARR
jgi:hypothetical protein